MSTGVLDRRCFLWGSAALALACGDDGLPVPTSDGEPWNGGVYLGLAPYVEALTRPVGEKYGIGWDARLLVDMTALEGPSPQLAADRFYLRTEVPDRLTTSDEDWRIAVTGLATGESFTIAELRSLEMPMGPVLLECSGNGETAKFGLMSSTTWAGVALSDLVALLQLDPTALAVEVIGFDDQSVPSANNHSTPGASWILPLADLASSGAFLATSMAGGPLTADHGRPVRLVVPNWYGCACIKWVTELRFVGAAAPSTGQMIEFADRTEQPGGGAVLALDYLAPVIDHAATVVRVERWDVQGVVRHRVIGLAWGGFSPPGPLTVAAGEVSWVAEVQPDRTVLRTWALWEAEVPAGVVGPTVFSCAIEGVRTRRLDRGYYDMAFALDG